MGRPLPRPDRDRLGTLTALVLITYSLVRIVVLPAFRFEFTVLGLIVRMDIDTRLVMLTLAAAMAAAGADWLVRSHPSSPTEGVLAVHWIVPALAALALGAVLTRLPIGPWFPVGLALGGLCLVAVLVGEFIVLDSTDPRHDAAAIGLRILSYLLLVGVFFTISAMEVRAFFVVPSVLVAVAAVTWRLWRLEPFQTSLWAYAVGLGWLVAQIAWAFHYWPMPPLREALILGLVVYEGTTAITLLLHEQMSASRMIELAIVGALALLATLGLT
jgi:hypothetical protein